jgi:hypothetical protein
VLAETAVVLLLVVVIWLLYKFSSGSDAALVQEA